MLHKRAFMPGVAAVSIIIFFFCLSAFCMDGFAIVVQCEGPLAMRQGSIIRVDIENDQVVQRRQIYDAAQGLAHWPRISLDGKKIAFYRKGSGKYHMSIMDADGRNVKNLVDLPDSYEAGTWGPSASMSWPAGDWIYFQKEGGSMTYWRVHAVTGAAEKLSAGDRANNLRSRINFDASRICDNSDYCSDFDDKLFGSQEHRFEARVRCNSGMSPSGRFLSGWGTVGNCKYGKFASGRWSCNYKAPMEDTVRPVGIPYHGWVDLTDMLNRDKLMNILMYYHDYTNYRHISYSMGTQYIKEQTGVPTLYYNAATAEIPLWACNSDKWWLTSPSWMTVAWNWPDRKGILIAESNVDERGRTGEKYMHADMWVKPPKDEYVGTHMEECDGNWIAVGQRSTCALPDYVACPGLDDPYECSIKYRGIVIMPQRVYDKIAAPYSEDCPGCANLVEEELSTIFVPKSSSIDLTVTRDDFDPPRVFGDPPDISWKVIGTGATVSPAAGITTTLTTGDGFSQCEVEVTVSRGATSKSVRKLATANGVGIRKTGAPLSRSNIEAVKLAGGGAKIVLPKNAVSVSVYRADGARIFRQRACADAVTVASEVLNGGVYFVRVLFGDGSWRQAHWLAGLEK